MINQQNNSPAMCDGYTVEIFSSRYRQDNSDMAMYGIRFKLNDGTNMEYSEITESKNVITTLLNLFLDYDIDKTHIAFIIEDFLTEMHLPK